MLTNLTTYEASYDYLFQVFYLLYFNFIWKICCAFPPLPTLFFILQQSNQPFYVLQKLSIHEIEESIRNKVDCVILPTLYQPWFQLTFINVKYRGES